MKMLGLVILAATCLVALFGGQKYFQSLSASQRVRDEIHDLHEEVEQVIVTGENRTVKVDMPRGYTLRFESNQLVTSIVSVPENGYDMRVSGPEIGPGEHTLRISIVEGTVKVSEIG
jgi:hypothetical protein